jgi:hypothetical protein
LILKLFGTALLLSITAFMLRSFGWRGAPVFAAVCAVLLVMESGDMLGEILGSLKEVSVSVGIAEPVGAAIKVLGLGYLFGICADLCRELGETGIAKAAETVGRVEIIAVAIPYFQEIIKVGVELIG